MHLSDKEWKELRKLLNQAWDDACWWRNLFILSPSKSIRMSRRYRDVSKIIEAAKAVDWSKLSEPDKIMEANNE